MEDEVEVEVFNAMEDEVEVAHGDSGPHSSAEEAHAPQSVLADKPSEEYRSNVVLGAAARKTKPAPGLAVGEEPQPRRPHARDERLERSVAREDKAEAEAHH